MAPQRPPPPRAEAPLCRANEVTSRSDGTSLRRQLAHLPSALAPEPAHEPETRTRTRPPPWPLNLIENRPTALRSRVD